METQNVALEQRAEQFFGDEADARLGTGWWSGVIAVFCGALALGGVMCLLFPQLLSSPELRPYYPMALIRALIQAMIWGALGFALLAALLGRRWRLALTAFVLALSAAALGGAAVPIDQKLTTGPAIGLDWFLLDLLAMSLIYVPIERIWPYYPQQRTFRPQWTLDVVYFPSTHLPIQVLSFLVLLPATKATEYLAVPALAHAIASLPFVLQFSLAVAVADTAAWTIHYALRRVPLLWRFLSIHH